MSESIPLNEQHMLTGALKKMRVAHTQPISYELRLGDNNLPLSTLLGKKISLTANGAINCIHCQRLTKTSFNQGYCYPCFTSLAQCDRCIMSPELCHFKKGTCREPEWGEANCFQEHIVYLANSSGLKVGITRHNQVPTRWIDQGAVAALPIFSVSSRHLSGLIETILKEWVADKTNWRKMLKHEYDELDLKAERQRILALAQARLDELKADYPGEIKELDEDVYEFDYPYFAWPKKVATHNLDKKPHVEGVLQAIKGQYLILDSGCLNIRKYTSYNVTIAIS